MLIGLAGSAPAVVVVALLFGLVHTAPSKNCWAGV
jgi:membrane protease YdiL (CAAX protease family)